MSDLPLEAWLAVGVVTAVAVIGSLYVLASIVRDASRRIELYEQVFQLRMEYTRRIREMQARGFKVEGMGVPGDFEVLEDGPATVPVKKAA
jgi:predicted enzyme related to lactoylglutathione lyase